MFFPPSRRRRCAKWKTGWRPSGCFGVFRVLTVKWNYNQCKGGERAGAESFRDSMKYRRCVIPARGFYEWNKSKEKFSFERQDSRRLFMAGCYNLFKNEMHFVILTTSANLSVAPVHDRMPLILEADELEQWILDDGSAVQMLHKIPVMMKMRADYEQMSLF